MKKLDFYTRSEADDDILPGERGVYPVYTLALSLKGFFGAHLPNTIAFQSETKKEDTYCAEFDPARFADFIKGLIEVSSGYRVSIKALCQDDRLSVIISRDGKRYSREHLAAIKRYSEADATLNSDGSIELEIRYSDPRKVVARAVSVEHIISEIEFHFLDFKENSKEMFSL